MKGKYLLPVLAMLMIALSLEFVAVGQKAPKAKPRTDTPGPCQNTKLCIQKMNAQLGIVRAYVKRLKPGDPVEFNPQPDPPGDPDPWYRRALQAYRGLQEEISDLSKYPPGPCKVGKCQDAIKDAQNKFGQLGRASDHNSANTALAAMKLCIDQLSRVLLVPQLDQTRTTRH
jgi:hypothetical protein